MKGEIFFNVKNRREISGFFYALKVFNRFYLLYIKIIYLWGMIDFINALTKSLKSENTDESRRRSEICASCPLKEKRFYADFVEAEIKEVNGYVCTECHCPIATKIFATKKENICRKW